MPAGNTMNRLLKLAATLLFALIAPELGANSSFAQQPDPRLALVIGESAYQQGALPTAANDAGLVANTLSEAGFEVIGARDLDQDALRRSLREFLDKAAAAGPTSTVFVYFSGYGLQLEGENFFVPVGARIGRDTEVPIEALRLSDFSRSLAAIPLKARIIVFDGAHSSPFAKSGPALASGLALFEPDPGTLVAFNAAPGTVAPPETGPYSTYAQALTEMMRDGGLPLNEVFARTRLRVSEKTKGAVVPWDFDKIDQPFSFFDRTAGAPPSVSREQSAALQNRPIRELTPEEAYGTAVERDTIAAYEEFLSAFPDHPLAKRVHAMLAARREAITWRRTVSANTPNAYWSYLKRYPNGPHAADSRRRLAHLTAPLVPPPVFDAFDYDVPPPPPEEYAIVDRPILMFDESDYGPPPPLPVYLLPPPPSDWVELAPPPPPPAPFYLPIPVPIPIPGWSRPPRPLLPAAPLATQPGTGRPLAPPTVPVGAGFIQPPQAIISRPPAATRPTNLPGQPGPQISVPGSATPAAPVTGLPANSPLSPNSNAPANAKVPSTIKPGQLQVPVKPGQTLTQPGLPGTQQLTPRGPNGLAPGAKSPQGSGTALPATDQSTPKPNAGATGQTPQQIRQQQLLHQKQQIDQQGVQQQQSRQRQLEQQKNQQQQDLQQKNLQQKNLQQQQLRQQQLENKSQQQMQQQQMHQQQPIHQPQIQQHQPQIQQQPIRQPQMQQQPIQQQQIQQRAQQPAAHAPPHPVCGQPGQPACPR
jgi:uncharacterized caspase-like protein